MTAEIDFQIHFQQVWQLSGDCEYLFQRDGFERAGLGAVGQFVWDKDPVVIAAEGFDKEYSAQRSCLVVIAVLVYHLGSRSGGFGPLEVVGSSEVQYWVHSRLIQYLSTEPGRFGQKQEPKVVKHKNGMSTVQPVWALHTIAHFS